MANYKVKLFTCHHFHSNSNSNSHSNSGLSLNAVWLICLMQVVVSIVKSISNIGKQNHHKITVYYTTQISA